jgi:hypothetical protein
MGIISKLVDVAVKDNQEKQYIPSLTDNLFLGLMKHDRKIIIRDFLYLLHPYHK